MADRKQEVVIEPWPPHHSSPYTDPDRCYRIWLDDKLAAGVSGLDGVEWISPEGPMRLLVTDPRYHSKEVIADIRAFCDPELPEPFRGILDDIQVEDKGEEG